jgi:putative ABC transport system permease protein
MSILRHACRSIRRTPLLASVIVCSLGIGIGANAVVFSWIEAAVLRPIAGVKRSSSLYWIEPRTDTGSYPGASWREYQDLGDRLRTVRDLLAFRMVPLYLGESGRVERAYGLLVSGNYFSALGLRPALGRFFTPEDLAHPGDPPFVVISHELWQARFQGSPDALGRSLRVNGREIAVIGVAPRGFHGTMPRLAFDLYLPATLAPVVMNGSRELDDRAVRGYTMMGFPAAGASQAAVQAELDTAMGQLAHDYPATNANVRAEALHFWQAPRGPQRFLAAALGVLQTIMLLLLGAVCGNVANLVLARVSAKTRESGIRLAMGARPVRLVCELLTETLLLSVAGGALGFTLAVWGTHALEAIPPLRVRGLPITFETNVDGLTALAAVCLAVACGIVSGLAPALHLASVDPAAALRGGIRASGGALRSALMGVQSALAIAVLIAAGLFLRSFMQARDADPGFQRDGVLLAGYDLSDRDMDAAAARAFAARLLDQLRALPSIGAAALAASVPLDIHGLPSRTFTIDGHSRPDAAEDDAVTNIVSPGYFALMGIPVRAGHDFADLRDVSSPAEAIVNDAFVWRFLRSAQPIGRRLTCRGRDYTIVGLVRNSTYNAFGEPPTPIIYFSLRDNPAMAVEVHVRPRTESAIDVAPDVRRTVRRLDPELPLYDIRTLNEHIEANLLFRRIPARMFSVLGPLLLVMVTIGLYALVDYATTMKRRDFGVRRALGGGAARVVRGAVADALWPVAAGALAGWLFALLGARDVVGAGADPIVFAGVPALLLIAASGACAVPAWRAVSTDVMATLREE